MASLTGNLFRGTGERDFDLEVVQGTWPSDMHGHVFIITPDRREPGGAWLLGHGVLSRIDCAPTVSGRVPFRSRIVDTPIRRLRDRFPDLFVPKFGFEMSPFGTSNLANTNVQALDGRLYIGYDVGRPLEVDPRTLDYLTPIGANDEWYASGPGLLEPSINVAAHPAVDYQTGELFFVNYDLMPGGKPEDREVWIAHFDGEQPIRRVRARGLSQFDTIHDIKATRNFLVFCDLPYVFEPQVMKGKPRTRPTQDYTNLWIVDRRQLAATPEGAEVQVREVRIPHVTSHIALDYEDDGDELTVYLEQKPTMDMAVELKDGTQPIRGGQPISIDYEGLVSLGIQPSAVGRHRIDARAGRLIESTWTYDAERFWGGVLWGEDSDWLAQSGRHRSVYFGSMGFDPGLVAEEHFQLYADYGSPWVKSDALPDAVPGALARVDLETMQFADIYSYADGAFPHPPTFVPRKGRTSDADGYVVVIVHRDGDKAVQVFDAQHIADGPVATATARGFTPSLSLHSCWMASDFRPAPYRVPFMDDVVGALKQLPSTSRRLMAMVSAGRKKG